jgi:hypothetical protein
MDLDIDGTTILYAVGAFFGAIAVLYFGRTFLFGLSTATKSFLLFLGFCAFVTAGIVVRQSILATVSYVLGTASYLSFFLYTVLTFELSTDQVFLFLAISSGIFTALAYLIREDRLDIGQDEARKAFAVIGVLALVLVGLDVLSPPVTYETDLYEEADYREYDVALGTMTVENGFLFPRPVDLPDYEACFYYNGTVRRADVYYEDTIDTIEGGATATMTIAARDPAQPDSIPGPVQLTAMPVQQQDSCPDTIDGDGIVLTEIDEQRYAD